MACSTVSARISPARHLKQCSVASRQWIVQGAARNARHGLTTTVSNVHGPDAGLKLQKGSRKSGRLGKETCSWSLPPIDVVTTCNLPSLPTTIIVPASLLMPPESGVAFPISGMPLTELLATL